MGILREVKLPFYTCEPVIVEACFLLARHSDALGWIERWIGQGQIQLDFPLSENCERLFAMMRKYSDLPMSLADACLVAMADAESGSRVFTFDRHFAIYRTSSRRKIRTLGLES